MLSRAADEIAEGRYDVSVPQMSGGDEIAHLAHGFRDTADPALRNRGAGAQLPPCRSPTSCARRSPTDWSRRPYRFKDYPLDPEPLPEELERLLRLGAGVVRTRTYPCGVSYAFRTYASAGALYPVEVYAARPDGLLHFHARELAVPAPLSGGDLRGRLARAGADPELARAGVVLLLTGILSRTAWGQGGRRPRRPICLPIFRLTTPCTGAAPRASSRAPVPVDVVTDLPARAMGPIPADVRPDSEPFVIAHALDDLVPSVYRFHAPDRWELLGAGELGRHAGYLCLEHHSARSPRPSSSSWPISRR